MNWKTWVVQEPGSHSVWFQDLEELDGTHLAPVYTVNRVSLGDFGTRLLLPWFRKQMDDVEGEMDVPGGRHCQDR